MKQNKFAEITLSESVYENVIEEFEEYAKSRLKYHDLLGTSNIRGHLILDCGCGSGMDSIIFSKLGNEVIGIDISWKAISIAEKRAKKEKVNFYPILGDLETLPLKSECFDSCFIGWTLHHFPDIRSVILEINRVLKSKGVIYIIEPNGSSLGVKMSKIFETFFSSLIIKEIIVDSPNETLHNHYYYIKILKSCCFTITKLGFCYLGGLPPLPSYKSKKCKIFTISLLHFLIHIRRIMYLLLVKVIPSSIGSIDLLITAQKDKFKSFSIRKI